MYPAKTKVRDVSNNPDSQTNLYILHTESSDEKRIMTFDSELGVLKMIAQMAGTDSVKIRKIFLNIWGTNKLIPISVRFKDGRLTLEEDDIVLESVR